MQPTPSTLRLIDYVAVVGFLAGIVALFVVGIATVLATSWYLITGHLGWAVIVLLGGIGLIGSLYRALQYAVDPGD